MDEDKSIQNAIKGYYSLDTAEMAALQGINVRIQEYVNATACTWVEEQALIHEFVQFMYDKHLVIGFSWTEWQAGRDWYTLDDDAKYDRLDVETALKLLTAVIRNDRFNDGALVRAFEDGSFPQIIQKLITI